MIGLIGNLFFVLGSIMFLYPASTHLGTWFFIIASWGLLIGVLGEIAARYEMRRRGRHGIGRAGPERAPSPRGDEGRPRRARNSRRESSPRRFRGWGGTANRGGRTDGDVDGMEVPEPDGAERCAGDAGTAQKEELIVLQDAAVVTWPADRKRPKTRQLHSLVGGGALGGSFWGMLFGLIFFVPLLGLVDRGRRRRGSPGRCATWASTTSSSRTCARRSPRAAPPCSP